MDNPEFVKRDGMTADGNYIQWLSDIKSRYRQSQIKAATMVNSSLIEFYWSLGRDIVTLKAESKWGSGILKQLSADLKELFPGQKGFSYTNLRYIKQWYLFFNQDGINCHQLGGEIQETKRQQVVGKIKSHQLGGDFSFPEIFGRIPWRHHIEIISKCGSPDEALFYINQTIDGNWSRSRLEYELSTRLHERQGVAISNFSRTLPAPQGQRAQEILKDPYNMSFLGIQKVHDEHELEEALVNNVTRFLIELGQGFAYVGRQMELRMPNGQTFFPDLVFYHIHLKCYVVIELKVVPFIPEFAGKINFYVSAADELLKREDDNPSIGLIICQSTDKTIVEWSFRGVDRPLGVASYQLREVVERTVKEVESKREEHEQ